MTTSRTINVFLGSSNELINDRNSFSDLIRSLDDIYEPRGIRIKLKRWEDFFAYCTGTRTQDDYNKVLTNCDISICMFHRIGGKFTIEEFEKSVEAYQLKQSPKPYVYVRALVDGEVEEEALIQFKKDLFDKMGHYWCNYATDDTMKLHFVMQFERLLNEDMPSLSQESNLKVEQGSVMLHGKKIADYANLPFAAENSEMKNLKEKIAALDSEVAQLRALNVETLRPMINQKLTERNECQQNLEQLEKQLLDMALSISRMISSGSPISERKRLAIEMFEKGNNKGVLEVLNEADIASDHERAKAELASGKQLVEAGKAVIAAAEQKIRSLVEELVMKAKTWISTYTEPNRFKEACKCYEQAIQMTRESLPEKDLAEILHKYGFFLENNKQFHYAEEYYQKALEIYERPAIQFSRAFEPHVAMTLNNLANIYSDTQHYSKAEEYYLRALNIRERWATYRLANEPYVATTLNNLAILYLDTRQYAKAETYNLRALEIRERFAQQDPRTFEADLTDSLINLANVYSRTKRHAEAEEYYLRALEIGERLAQQVPNTHESKVALILNNLGFLYSNTTRFNKAEEYYLRALEVRERLAQQNPTAFESDFATALDNLASVYSDIERYAEAETYHLRALEIRERLAQQYPDAYELKVAQSLEGLAFVYYYTKRRSESVSSLLRALEIRERWAIHNPKALDPKVALTLYDLSIIYFDMRCYTEVEKCSLRALEIYERLAKQNPEEYESEIADILNSLAITSKRAEHYAEAETYYLRALGIYERLVQQNPKVLESYAITLRNLASLYKIIPRFNEAETYYLQSLKIYERLAEKNPNTFSGALHRVQENYQDLLDEMQKSQNASSFGEG